MRRHRVAKAMGKDRYREVVQEDIELMREFGFNVLSFEHGTRGTLGERKKRINPWDVVEIPDRAMEWLMPLLTELAERREADRVDSQMAAK